jgi:hypothetical protein
MHLCLEWQPRIAYLTVQADLFSHEATMATREPPVELFYDLENLRPGAPRLYVWRNDNEWELLDQDGVVLSTHPSQNYAIDAARERSRAQFSEILVRGSTGRVEWRLDQDPGIAKITDRLRARHLMNGEAAD